MGVDFGVTFPAPVDVAASLELFRRSGDDLLDRWDGRRLLRAVQITGTWVPFMAMPDGTLANPTMRVLVESPEHLSEIRQVVERTFVLAPPDYPELLERDVVLARLDAQFHGIRQIRQLDLFTAFIRCISAQQVNLRWAVTTRRRLAEAFGQPHAVAGQVVYSLNPERLASADPADIRALQFTTSKSVAIVAVARAMTEEALSMNQLQALADEEVIARLVAIRGIGRWSAEWILARTLGRPRVVAGDLAVRKAVGLAYLGHSAPSESEVRAVTAHWGQSAGVAQAVLLQALGEGALSWPTPPVARAALRQ
ncbi:MAG: DNA-3-methyladenine glycosylase family protein [Chloroflexota bacterium]